MSLHGKVEEAVYGYGTSVTDRLLAVLEGKAPMNHLTSILPRLSDPTPQSRDLDRRIRALRAALGNEWAPRASSAGENGQ